AKLSPNLWRSFSKMDGGRVRERKLVRNIELEYSYDRLIDIKMIVTVHGATDPRYVLSQLKRSGGFGT
ncbi:MAG: hypothetical protein MUO68_20860, partial [Desulfobacteraceae bacterium]|nr:hypothetical protein [Desulfobacteraceae bacterium]